MSPEFGSTCAFFPVDDETLTYLGDTGRETALVKAYAQAQGYWRPDMEEPVFTDTLELDLSAVLPSISGPKRPQDHVLLSEADTEFLKTMQKEFGTDGGDTTAVEVEGEDFTVTHGDVFIAAITSCTVSLG